MVRSIPAGAKRRVVVLGGGFGGAYAVQEILRRRRGLDIEVTVLDRNNYLLFYPLLVEAGVGVIEPRHVVVPIHKFMPGSEFQMAEVLSVDLALREVRYRVIGDSAERRITYDELILAVGSVNRIPDNVPGLREHGFELKTLADAIGLRDRAIQLLELANTIADEAVRRELLTVVVVGANFTGVELAGEYHAFLTASAKRYPRVSEKDIQVKLLEYGDRILPAVRKELAQWAHRTLEQRGLDIRTHSTVTEIGSDFAVLVSGERVPTHTVVWAAGIAPNPLLSKIPGLPLNEKGYVRCERDLRVQGMEDVWCVGDSGTVYDKNGKPYAATAQNASRQGPHAARNILAKLKGEDTRPFDFEVLGSFAAIGRRSAAAEFLGRDVKGLLGWILYRGAYLMKLPTLGVKLRVGLDWALELVLPADPVQLGVHRGKTSPPPDPDSSSVEAPMSFFKLLR